MKRKKSIFGCLNESSQNIAHPVGTENIDTPPVLRGIHSRFPERIGRLRNVGHAHGTIRLQIAQPERILPCAMPACLVCPHLDNGRMSPHFPRNESLWCGTHPVFFLLLPSRNKEANEREVMHKHVAISRRNSRGRPTWLLATISQLPVC